jgi:hypothetical protein
LRRLPHTNSYQEHKNKRPIRRVSHTGRAKNEGNQKGDEEDSHHREEDQISLEIKLSTEESSNSHGEDLGAESRMWKEKKQRENCFCREGVTGQFFKIDRAIWLILPTGLIGLH